MYSSIKQQSSTEWNRNYFCTNPVLHQCSFLSFDNCTVVCSVQSLSCVWLYATPWTAARQASLSIANFQSPPKPMSIESVMPCNHLILCRPLLLPSIFPSIRVFSIESALHIRWPKYWSFSFSISPSREYSGLISFRIDWLDLLAAQGTLKSLLQHHGSKASILWRVLEGRCWACHRRYSSRQTRHVLCPLGAYILVRVVFIRTSAVTTKLFLSRYSAFLIVFFSQIVLRLFQDDWSNSRCHFQIYQTERESDQLFMWLS